MTLRKHWISPKCT